MCSRTHHNSTSTSSSYSSSPTKVLNDPTPYQLTNPGDVPTAVRNLLSSTKRLQEVLKLWSIEQATEGDVSELYVQIGHEFNTTIGAFAYHHIDLSDIHNMTAELRIVLESCLSEDPSPDVLASVMPDLHRVLYKLLKGLQKRQDKWRSRVEGCGSSSGKSYITG